MSALAAAQLTDPVKDCIQSLGILHAGAQVTPGDSVNSGAAFAWEALLHSDNHRYAPMSLIIVCPSPRLPGGIRLCAVSDLSGSLEDRLGILCTLCCPDA